MSELIKMTLLGLVIIGCGAGLYSILIAIASYFPYIVFGVIILIAGFLVGNKFF